MRYLYLIVGRSGSGKTELTETLAEHFNAKIVQSYTTRQKRKPDETGHIFAKPIDYFKAKEKNMVVAETIFSGNYYWAQSDQIEECDLYVVDPKGVSDVKKAFENNIINKEPFVIKLSVSRKEAAKRMAKRGDMPNNVQTRLMNDDLIFNDFYYDAKINANASRENVAKEAIAIIEKQENKK